MPYKLNVFTGDLDFYEPTPAGTISGNAGLTALYAGGVETKVVFANPFGAGVTNYSLIINAIDANGETVGYTRGTKFNDGFNITPDYDAYINYIAII